MRPAHGFLIVTLLAPLGCRPPEADPLGPTRPTDATVSTTAGPARPRALPQANRPTPADGGRIQAHALHMAYLANPLDADARYKDKQLTVQGTVVGVQSEQGRHGFLLMVADSVRNNLYPGVIVWVAEDAREQFRDVNAEAFPKQDITVRGVCTGARRDYRSFRQLAVDLTDCHRVHSH